VTSFYITTAIDYSNGDPHLGHALEKVGADAIARWHRLRGERVHFLLGMDENAQKVIQAAEAANRTPAEWLDTMSTRFESTWQRLGCSHDIWMRTSSPAHAAGVTKLIGLIQSRHADAFYEGEYEGLYCVGCEEFKSESQIVNGRCIEHPSRELVPTRERNTFFRLSAWTAPVLEAISSGTFRVEPQIRRNEILRVLDDGLIDISVSRSRLPIGVPFPGAPDQTVYVWFEALMNYLTATTFSTPGDAPEWPANIHVVGKGITRFHCCIWPAILLAAGLPLPGMVWAHGYVQWGGAKVSKSEGSASISLDEAIDRRGADALRWFLLREVGFENDGDFSLERFDARYDGDLANGLGNLAARVTAMVEKYRDGVAPGESAANDPLDIAGDRCVKDYTTAMDAIDLKGGATAISSLVSEANSYIVANAPWTLAKAGEDARLDGVLGSLVRCLLRLSVMASPYMPVKAQALWAALGQQGAPETEPAWLLALTPDVAGVRVSKPENLFPKLG
jgi:methionyl-tRNA synthetase